MACGVYRGDEFSSRLVEETDEEQSLSEFFIKIFDFTI